MEAKVLGRLLLEGRLWYIEIVKGAGFRVRLADHPETLQNDGSLNGVFCAIRDFLLSGAVWHQGEVPYSPQDLLRAYNQEYPNDTLVFDNTPGMENVLGRMFLEAEVERLLAAGRTETAITRRLMQMFKQFSGKSLVHRRRVVRAVVEAILERQGRVDTEGPLWLKTQIPDLD
jgi:hypothetical protein